MEDYWKLFVADAIRSGKADPGAGRIVNVFFGNEPDFASGVTSDHAGRAYNICDAGTVSFEIIESFWEDFTVVQRLYTFYHEAGHAVVGHILQKMGDVIKDFYKSDAPQFKGKSKAKRRQMAIAAKLSQESSDIFKGLEQVEETATAGATGTPAGTTGTATATAGAAAADGGSGQHGGQHVLALHADVEQVHAEPDGHRDPGQVQLCGPIAGRNQGLEAGAV